MNVALPSNKNPDFNRIVLELPVALLFTGIGGHGKYEEIEIAFPEKSRCSVESYWQLYYDPQNPKTSQSVHICH